MEKDTVIFSANRNACLKLTKSFFFPVDIFEVSPRWIDKSTADYLHLQAKGVDTR